MWIGLSSTRPYLVRIYVNGVNVVTGQNTQKQDKQGYLVAPDQGFVNGYKSSPKTPVIQFRCPPLFHADATKQNSTTLRFEITPYANTKLELLQMRDHHAENERTIAALPNITVENLSNKYNLQFEDTRSVPSKLVYCGKELESKIK